MAVKSRRKAIRNWARGSFAFLWIVLGGLSSFYLFTLFSDPAALSGYTVQLGASAGAGPGVAIPPGKGSLSASQATALKDQLHALSDQMAQITTRLEPIEDDADAAASMQPSVTASTTTPEAPAPIAEAYPTPEPVAQEPVEMVAVEETEIVATAPASPALVVVPTEPVAIVTTAPEPAPRAGLILPPSRMVANEPVVPPMAADAPAPEIARAPLEPAPPVVVPLPPVVTDLASLDPIVLPPGANDGSTRYGIEIGTVSKRDALRPLWRELLTEHAALVAGLQPRRILAPDKKWRLIAGPFANARDAEGACTLFKKADRPCAATVYAGDAL